MMQFFDERDDIHSAPAIEKWITTSVASFNQVYGKRAYAAINTMGVSALIYLKEQGYDPEVEDPMVSKMQGFA